MTLAEARAALRPDMTIAKRQGEYRVNFVRGHEGTAYYTDDLDDAVATGLAMAQWLTEQRLRAAGVL